MVDFNAIFYMVDFIMYAKDLKEIFANLIQTLTSEARDFNLKKNWKKLKKLTIKLTIEN